MQTTPESSLIPTPDDHDAGFKDINVELRSGKIQTIRVKAVSFRKLRELQKRKLDGAEYMEAITAEALADCALPACRLPIGDTAECHSALQKKAANLADRGTSRAAAR